MSYTKTLHPLGFYQVHPLPSQQELETYYREKYFQTSQGSYEAVYSPDEITYFLNQAAIAQYIWQSVHPEVPITSPTLMDVGCGEGFLMHYFHRAGWQVEGCDFSSYGLEQQNPDVLPYFTQGDIYQTLEAKIATGVAYDLINLSNVLEHVRDPLSLLDRLKAIMHGRSLLRIVVPNDYSNLQALLLEHGLTGETWFVPPDHLNYFTFASLTALLRDRGFHIVKLLADFPIETFLFNAHSNYWADRSKGKQAHQCRVTLENFLVSQGMTAYVNYRAAAAACGFGRSAIAFVSLSPLGHAS